MGLGTLPPPALTRSGAASSGPGPRVFETSSRGRFQLRLQDKAGSDTPSGAAWRRDPRGEELGIAPRGSGSSLGRLEEAQLSHLSLGFLRE